MRKLNRLILAERMHWTLEYIDDMDIDEYAETLAYLDALDKARCG